MKSIVRTACAVEASTDPHHFFYRATPQCMPGECAGRATGSAADGHACCACSTGPVPCHRSASANCLTGCAHPCPAGAPAPRSVNTRHQGVPGPKSPQPVLERLGLYHYAVKSIDDFKQKMARGSGMGNVKTLAFLEYVDNFTGAHCADALDLGLQLHGLMALQEAL